MTVVEPDSTRIPPGGPTVDANQELVAGTMIAGRYKIDQLLGRGGFGAVYSVRHSNTGEALALKLLNPALAVNKQAVERFRTEARAPVKIGTDNVVRVKQLAAGDHIVLNGRIQQDVWNDDTGTTRYDIKFVSNNVTVAEPRHHPDPTIAAHVAHTAQTASAAVTVTAGR